MALGRAAGGDGDGGGDSNGATWGAVGSAAANDEATQLQMFPQLVECTAGGAK